MREAIARAIYENAPGPLCPWDELPPERKIGWLSDADCVIGVLEALPMAGSPIEASGGASVAKPPRTLGQIYAEYVAALRAHRA